jgi:hypothetical protein
MMTVNSLSDVKNKQFSAMVGFTTRLLSKYSCYHLEIPMPDDDFGIGCRPHSMVCPLHLTARIRIYGDGKKEKRPSPITSAEFVFYTTISFVRNLYNEQPTVVVIVYHDLLH